MNAIAQSFILYSLFIALKYIIQRYSKETEYSHEENISPNNRGFIHVKYSHSRH